MKKKIRIRMTNDMCEKLTGARGRYDLALPEIDVDLDALSPAARWIAEHITATYVLDEARDVIGISAEAGFSMRDRDVALGLNAQMVHDLETTWGAFYSEEPMRIEEITFPIMGRRYSRPEEVLEDTAAQLIDAGAVKLTARNGDSFALK